VQLEPTLLANPQIARLEADMEILREHKPILHLHLPVTVIAYIDCVCLTFPSFAIFHVPWWTDTLDMGWQFAASLSLFERKEAAPSLPELQQQCLSFACANSLERVTVLEYSRLSPIAGHSSACEVGLSPRIVRHVPQLR
jgi:hypothetical protein